MRHIRAWCIVQQCSPVEKISSRHRYKAHLKLQSLETQGALSTSLCPLHYALQMVQVPARLPLRRQEPRIQRPESSRCLRPYPQTVGFPGSSCENSSRQILHMSSSASRTGTARLHRSMLPRLSRLQSTELSSPQVELVAWDWLSPCLSLLTTLEPCSVSMSKIPASSGIFTAARATPHLLTCCSKATHTVNETLVFAGECMAL